MTRALRHRRCEIENAGRVAKELGLSVRLESDGAITLIPDNHNLSRVDVTEHPEPFTTLDEYLAWRDRSIARED